MKITIILLSLFTIVSLRTSRRKNYKPKTKPEEKIINPDKSFTIGVIMPNSVSTSRVPQEKTDIRSIIEIYNRKFERLLKPNILQFSFKDIQGNLNTPELYRTMCGKKGLLKNKINAILYIENLLSKKSTGQQPYSQQLLNTANFYQIPILTWDLTGTLQANKDRLMLQLTPSLAQQAQAMLHLLKRYNWRSFAIVTGRLYGYDRFSTALMDLIRVNDEFETMEMLTKIHILSFKSHDHVRQELERISAVKARVMLIYSSREEATQIFDVASLMGITGKNYVWIAAKCVIARTRQLNENNPVMLEFDHVKFPPGMFAIHFADDREHQKSYIRRGISLWLKAVLHLHQKARRTKLKLRPPYNCSSSEGKIWKYGPFIFDAMLDNSIWPNNSDHIMKHFSMSEDGTLGETKLDILNLGPNNERNERQWTTVGEWNSTEDKLKMKDITWPGEAAAPPIGRPEKYELKIVTLDEKPYVVYSDPDPNFGTCPPMAVLCRIAPENETRGVANSTSNPKLYQCCSGLCIDLLKMLSEKMHFNFELFQVSDGKWGAYDKTNNEWNGLIKDILDGKADMVVTSLKINPERARAIDFSVPFLETGITIIVAVRDGVISPTAFLEPYDYPSWCLILIFSVHASGAAIFIFEWLSPSGLDKGRKPIGEHRFSLFRGFWLIWAMLFGAAVQIDNPRGVSSRFLGNIWALFAVVFTASYTANLAAFMITKEDYDRLSGIQDWRLMNPRAHKPPFKFATVPDGSTETNLRNNYPAMYDYMKQFNRSKVEDGVKAVKDGDINAFIYDATVLEYLAGQDDGCKLRTVGAWYAMTGYGIGFPKGSKWKEIVNKYLLQFQHEGRELERLQKFWLAGACSLNKDEGESSMPLGILNFTSAFILLAGGMFLGVLLLLLEHVYFKFFRAKLRRWDKCGCCGLISLSMGKSLTFEESVREAITFQKLHKCNNAMCDATRSKLRRELDLAIYRINRMEEQLRNTCAPESYRMLNGKKAFFTSKSEPTTPESSRKHYTSTPLVRYPSLETEKWQDPSENPHENEDYKKSVMKKRHKGLCYIPIEDVEKETVL